VLETAWLLYPELIDRLFTSGNWEGKRQTVIDSHLRLRAYVMGLKVQKSMCLGKAIKTESRSRPRGSVWKTRVVHVSRFVEFCAQFLCNLFVHNVEW